jgi:hypothetical protein
VEQCRPCVVVDAGRVVDPSVGDGDEGAAGATAVGEMLPTTEPPDYAPVAKAVVEAGSRFRGPIAQGLLDAGKLPPPRYIDPPWFRGGVVDADKDPQAFDTWWRTRSAEVTTSESTVIVGFLEAASLIGSDPKLLTR